MSQIIDFAGYECTGCGRTTEQMSVEDGWTDEDFDNNQVSTNSGLWYCHRDCLRDTL